MEKYCISVDLAPSCCTRNYLESVCRCRTRVFRGRKYKFVWSPVDLIAGLVCNGVLIGIVHEGKLKIYSQFSSPYLTASSVGSIMALFNLYPC